MWTTVASWRGGRRFRFQSPPPGDDPGRSPLSSGSSVTEAVLSPAATCAFHPAPGGPPSRNNQVYPPRSAIVKVTGPGGISGRLLHATVVRWWIGAVGRRSHPTALDPVIFPASATEFRINPPSGPRTRFSGRLVGVNSSGKEPFVSRTETDGVVYSAGEAHDLGSRRHLRGWR